MSFEHTLQNITLPAGSDLSAAQYKFVLLASDGQVDLVGTKGANATGVLQGNPNAAGIVSPVAVGGVTKIELSGTVATGGEIISEDDGTGIAKDAVSQNVQGICLAGGVTGDIVPMLMTKYLTPAA